MRALALALAVLACPRHPGAMGVLPPPEERALDAAGRLFRAGDAAGARAALDPWVARSARAAREGLALRFVSQDYAGVLALDRAAPSAAGDDESRLWVARSDAALGRWPDCLVRLGRLAEPGRPWPLGLKAEALVALRDPGAASACAAALSAAAGGNLEAPAALRAAEEAGSRYDEAAAEAYYLRAQKADPAYTLVNARLAEIYLCQGRWRDARARIEREAAVDPRAEGPRRALGDLLGEVPALRDAGRQDLDARLARFEARPCPRVAPVARLPGEPLLRVGLLSGVDRVFLKLGAPMRDEGTGLTLPAGSAWVACAGEGSGWTLAPVGTNTAPARLLSGPLRLRPLDPAGTFGLFEVSHGLGYFFAGARDRYYRGLLEVGGRPGGLLVVDELGMEAYLRSVVPSEIPASWPAECRRAQAIAARTAAWGSLGRFRRDGYDLCPSVACAEYDGAGAEKPGTDSAVASTAGMVLENPSGGLAPVFYMDDSGGHTLAAEGAWARPDPGSVGVPDCPADATATLGLFPLSASGLLRYLDDQDGRVRGWSQREGRSTWRWILRLTPAEMAPALDRAAPIGEPRAVLGLERSAGGYLERVRIVGDKGAFTAAGDRIRSVLKGLKSNLFYVETRLDARGRAVAFLFHGGGWGHGVGLSQSGAAGMAMAGLDDHAILRHYFPEDRIRRRYRDAAGVRAGGSVFDPVRGLGSGGDGI